MTPEEDALRVERARRLIESPPAEPMDWELSTLRRAVALARTRLGLPSRIVFRWRYPRPDASRGAHVDGVVYLGLPPGSTRDDLAAVILHELKHASDHLTDCPFDREQWEKRADSFSAEMMECWRSGTAPGQDEETDDEEEDEEDQAATEERALPKPKSLTPSPSDARARHVLDDVIRRFERLRRHLDGDSRRSLRAIEHRVMELGDLAKRKA